MSTKLNKVKKKQKKQVLFDMDEFTNEMSYLYQAKIGRDHNFSKTGLNNSLVFKPITKNLTIKDISRSKGFS